MIKLYGVLRSRASRNVWLLNELGVPFERVPVMQAYRLADPSAATAPFHTGSAEFRAINPNGLIPTLNDDGFVMHESLAINIYLARKYGGPLAPANAHEDGLMTMWALWAATEVEPNALLLLRHRRDYAPDRRDPAVALQCIEALRKPFAVLNAALRDGGGTLVGNRFTVADLNTVEVCRYAQVAPELFADNPDVQSWMDTCHSRPHFKAMWEARSAEPA